jgi:hypothetical protein
MRTAREYMVLTYMPFVPKRSAGFMRFGFNGLGLVKGSSLGSSGAHEGRMDLKTGKGFRP